MITVASVKIIHIFEYSDIQINSKKFVDKPDDKVKNAYSCESVHKQTDRKLGFVNAADCLPDI
jgi:hypothetical protein